MTEREEKIQKLMGESTSDEKKPLMEELLEEAGHDFRHFLYEIHYWITKEKRILPKMEEDKHHRWKNHTGDQIVDSLQFLKPSKISELVDIVRKAEELNCIVKAVGSGHSFSDVTQTTDFLVATDKLNCWIELDKTLLKENVDTQFLVHVEGGMKIHELNDHLDKRGLALINMGGYDGQSIAGATSTGTHGSGIAFGPLASFYKSIVLIADGSTKYRIEPSNGITDPVKYKSRYPENILIQDDEWFNTVAVSMGCTGIIYSVILEVMPKYWLKEVRTLTTWDEVKKMLEEGKVLQDNRHFEVLINPYRHNDQHTCLITTRNICKEPILAIADKIERNFLSELLGIIPGMFNIIDFMLMNFPQVFPKLIESALKGLADDSYINKSYKVFNIGTANKISAYGSELSIPMKDNLYIKAVERIFEVADKMKFIGNVYHTSPFSLRFVKSFDAYFSMMQGRDTCMIEIPVANFSYSGMQLLEHYEKELMQFEMRPHWGMVNFLTGSNGLIKRLYPHHDTWMKVFRQLNKKGTFSNRFTYRCGFTEYQD